MISGRHRDRLAHYASQFPIVEVDATYYALPAERNEKPNISAAERFRYLYTEEKLKGWLAPIRRLAEADHVHVLMNNCYGDYGVRNARQLAELLAGQTDCSHSPSFDHRRRVCFPFTAIAIAIFCPTMTTSCFPRVTAV